ncbi:LysR family transcriptional regulator [Cupriavidus consociatus]|uniref:LysR family transcriptional regulator n=1 Tax=Cupriavidus consociatus TaxID=2821357 RepID=UPI001AEAE1F5|nr:LysR family transcriptional regulator [Cupriavidus sp. LEh21]MBP0622395.1 LysR family transcriptional regulator [Cupriavidus sp. LEh25]MDK2659082.1 LysR family transcriptional regulator [Cupriavidus sp. LEh21]
MITIKQVEAFYWTAKLGTVQRAASKLHVTQSAATKRLQELERIAALPLFDASGRKSALTPKGLELLGLCEEFLAATARLDEVKASAKHVARTLHIGITEMVALTWFPTLVRKLKSIYPQVTLQPDVDLSASLHDKVSDGRLDIAVIIEPFNDSTMASVRLGSAEFGWVAPPGTFDSEKVYSLEQLSALPLIQQDKGSGARILCDTQFAQAGIEPQRINGSNSLVTLAGLVEAGVGVSCIPLRLFNHEIREQRIQVVKTDPAAPSLTYYAVFLKQHQAALGYAVADMARQCCDFEAKNRQTRRQKAP